MQRDMLGTLRLAQRAGDLCLVRLFVCLCLLHRAAHLRRLLKLGRFNHERLSFDGWAIGC